VNPAVLILAGALLFTAVSLSAGESEAHNAPLTVLGGNAEEVIEVRVLLELRFAAGGRIERESRQTEQGALTLRFPAGLSGWRLTLTPTNASAACVVSAWAGDLPSTDTAFLLRHAAEHRANPLYPEAFIIRMPPAKSGGKRRLSPPLPDPSQEHGWWAWCDRQFLICWHFLATDRFVTPLSGVWRIEDPLPGLLLPPEEVITACPNAGPIWPADPSLWLHSWREFGPDQEISGLPWPLSVQFPYSLGGHFPDEHWDPPPFAPLHEGAPPRSQPLPNVRP
jgi:hypothetical protein